jgi:hypothetical protein
MRILVTGSRDWTDQSTIFDAIEAEYHCHEHPAEDCAHSEMIIVHGHCSRGADQIADTWASWAGYKVERHPAEWERYGKRAGYIRNAEMAALGADVCLAFIKDNSPGSTMMVKLAEDAGIPTKIWRA